MALYDVTGTASGAGSVVGTLSLQGTIQGTLSGAGTVTGDLVQYLLFSGLLAGSGAISDPLDVSSSGVLVGAGSITGNETKSVILHAYPMMGSGTIDWSLPDPLVGTGILSGFIKVERIAPPVCCTRPKKTLRWGQTFGPGDLFLVVCDSLGNIYSPVVVSYAIYQIMRGGYRQLIGNPSRTPVMTSRGCFYATGSAGDCGGQPGEWCIVWTWQRANGFPMECLTEFFTLQDAAMANPCDPARKRKLGWGC